MIRGSDGFTLLEVIVALGIVGATSLSALGAVAGAASSSERIAASLVANELAEERMASLLTLLPAALADSADGRLHVIDGLPVWAWSATLSDPPHAPAARAEHGAARMIVVSVRVIGPGAERTFTALRPRNGRDQ